MKKLFLMIPLFSVIGLMNGCDLFGEKDPDYVDAYIKVSHLIRDTIIILDPQDLGEYSYFIENYPDGDSIRFMTDYNEERIVANVPSYVYYEKKWSIVNVTYKSWGKVKIDGEALDVTYTFWFPNKTTSGKLQDGTRADFIKVYWDASEKPNADDQIIVKSKIWFKYKSQIID